MLCQRYTMIRFKKDIEKIFGQVKGCSIRRTEPT